MNRAVKFVLAANLIALTILTFTYPNLMVGPGKLIVGHQDLEEDCFACHAPFVGATAERCVTCHKPADIGRLTTAAQPIAKPLTSTPFHQQLIKDDCMACHSDHAGVKRYRHAGRFKHDLLRVAALNECQTCHRAPTDSIHRDITGNCAQCHSQDQWIPATYDHNQYFLLDRDHQAPCATCHERNDYSRYSCYGCHKHNPEKIRREHIEEGIRDFRNCVECHRTANKHDIRGKGQEGGKDHARKKKHDDD